MGHQFYSLRLQAAHLGIKIRTSSEKKSKSVFKNKDELIKEIHVQRRLSDLFGRPKQHSCSVRQHVAEAQTKEAADETDVVPVASVSPKESQEGEKEAAEGKEVGLPRQQRKTICVGAFEKQERRIQQGSAKKVL